ncbi:hypothetical protein C8R44DRAFT_864526 [Mycena epipterygia]|nr:hypothetical protein C8R44DRAFT_864526 [Mycena epipterygia]
MDSPPTIQVSRNEETSGWISHRLARLMRAQSAPIVTVRAPRLGGVYARCLATAPGSTRLGRLAASPPVPCVRCDSRWSVVGVRYAHGCPRAACSVREPGNVRLDCLVCMVALRLHSLPSRSRFGNCLTASSREALELVGPALFDQQGSFRFRTVILTALQSYNLVHCAQDSTPWDCVQ